jgi:predicted unusual protein kinase regulating ubiquinone biosynthesis (AarF/ABC1/UbiB family)
MACSSGPNPSERPDLTPHEIADRLEMMAQALKALSDPTMKRQIIREMRTLLAEAERKL